ncbi:MAG: triose-phosphate isomerase [Desulfuromonadales bacterium]|nr:triose-phosphate isomerase [Desulfuromonadales bacterium]
MRKPLIAGNWKLNKTVTEATELVSKLKNAVADIDTVEIMIAPPFTALSRIADLLQGCNITLGAQNCYPEACGAFTGEISAELLKDVGCQTVIIGHSERRQLFNEPDNFINRKMKATLKAGLTAILCIGETLQEREDELMFDVLTTQLQAGLTGLTAEQMQKVVIAYEPVWAIGTGKTASSDEAQEVHSFLRGILQGTVDQPTALATRIIYGGSVKPDNIDGLMAQNDIDGALVGGASLKAGEFERIIRFQ